MAMFTAVAGGTATEIGVVVVTVLLLALTVAVWLAVVAVVPVTLEVITIGVTAMAGADSAMNAIAAKLRVILNPCTMASHRVCSLWAPFPVEWVARC